MMSLRANGSVGIKKRRVLKGVKHLTVLYGAHVSLGKNGIK